MTDFFRQYDNEVKAHKPDRSGSFCNVPDGDYKGHINEVTQDSWQGIPTFKWDVIIDVGPEKGKHLQPIRFVKDVEAACYLKDDLWKCGVEIEILEELSFKMKLLLDRPVSLTVKTNHKDGKAYKNIYFNWPEQEEVSIGGDVPPPHTDNDLPF